MGTDNLETAIQSGQLSRQDFIQFCLTVSMVLSIPMTDFERVFNALSTPPRTPVVWLEFSEQSYTEPTTQVGLNFRRLISDVKDLWAFQILQHFIDLDYTKYTGEPGNLMHSQNILENPAAHRGEYICVLAGPPPEMHFNDTNSTFSEVQNPIIRTIAANAKATIALTPCFSARDERTISYAIHPTELAGLQEVENLLYLPGCPADAFNIAASIVHIITYQELPPVNEDRLPLFLFTTEFDDEMDFAPINTPANVGVDQTADRGEGCDCLEALRRDYSKPPKSLPVETDRQSD